MTEEQVIKIILTALEKNFPKDCSCCGHRFYTFKEYLNENQLLGPPRSYDAEIEEWHPKKPLGIYAFARCNFCSNTLTTNLSSLKDETTWQLLSWIRDEMKQKGVSSSVLLNDIRGKILKQISGE